MSFSRYKKYKQNFVNIEDEKETERWVSTTELSNKLKNWNILAENISKTIMEDFWAKALLESPENVVQLFWENALLKWTVVQHLAVGKEYWVLDYFEHFCERNPEMQLKSINAKYLKWWKTILARWEYLFKLHNPEQDVPANFTMIFVNRNWRWVIDVLHSSIKYNKEELEKLNKE